MNNYSNNQSVRRPSSLVNTELSHRENEKQMYFTCPMCGVNLSVPMIYRNHDELKCFHCRGIFKNPYYYPNDNTVYKKNITHKESNYFSSNQTKKQFPSWIQILRILLVWFLIWAIIKSCTQTPEESMKIYKEQQKKLREKEKEDKDTEEFFEFMGGQE